MNKNSNSLNHSLHPMSNSRRRFLKQAALGTAILNFPTSLAFASSKKNNKKVIWVVLRGALDSLHTVIPTQDTNYQIHRPQLAKSFSKPLLPLNSEFSLHYSLKNCFQLYQDKSLLPIIAVGSGYSARSHFDGQDFLESGLGVVDQGSGWLARGMNAKKKKGIAVSQSMPVSFRQSEFANTWYPSKLKLAENDFYQQLGNLYSDNMQMQSMLDKGLALRNTVKQGKKQRGQFVELADACAKLLIKDPSLDCAMLELGGWDTHNQQANRLQRNLSLLDKGIASLQKGLGKQWNDTLVIVATEFGRTVKENGTKGTDHGTGSVMFLTGGAVKGGKVMGQWPGLKNEQLFEGRDLKPTSNTFDWIATALQQHWQLSDLDIANVFPKAKLLPYQLIS